MPPSNSQVSLRFNRNQLWGGVVLALLVAGIVIAAVAGHSSGKKTYTPEGDWVTEGLSVRCPDTEIDWTEPYTREQTPGYQDVWDYNFRSVTGSIVVVRAAEHGADGYVTFTDCGS